MITCAYYKLIKGKPVCQHPNTTTAEENNLRFKLCHGSSMFHPCERCKRLCHGIYPSNLPVAVINPEDISIVDKDGNEI